MFKKLSFIFLAMLVSILSYANVVLTYNETTKKIVGRPKQKDYAEFMKDVKAGYYDNVKMCLPLRTIVELFDMFPGHVDELLDLFSLKFEKLKEPK